MAAIAKKVADNFQIVDEALKRGPGQNAKIVDFLKMLLRNENLVLMEDYTYMSIEQHLPRFLQLRFAEVQQKNSDAKINIPVELRRFCSYFLEQVAHFKHKMSIRCIPACMMLFNDTDLIV